MSKKILILIVIGTSVILFLLILNNWAQIYPPEWIWWMLIFADGVAIFFFSYHLVLTNRRLREEIAVRKQAEEQLTKNQKHLEECTRDLRESEERLLALDTTNTGMYDVNIKTGKIYLSSRFYTMLGYESNELPTTVEAFFNLIHPDYLECIEERFKKHFETGSDYKTEMRIKKKNGEWCWIIDSGKVIEWDGQLLRMVGVNIDISDLKRVDESSLKEIQEQYMFRISDDYVKHLCMLKATQTYYQTLNLMEIAQECIELFDKSINELKMICNLAQRDATFEIININVNNEEVFIEFSIKSPHNLAPFGSFLLSIILHPQREDNSYVPRYYLLTFLENEPVHFQETIPLPQEFLLKDNVTDNEGSLRSDALSVDQTILCEIYLGTKKLYSKELTFELDTLYQNIMDSLK